MRAEKFGDLITADHKVLNEDCESRNNHRYAVFSGSRSCHSMDPVSSVWKQDFTGNRKSACGSSSSDHKSQRSFTLTNLWNLQKDLSWNHRTSTPHRSETNGIAERAVRRVKEGASAVLLQAELDERWWSDSMECCCYLRNVEDFVADGKTPLKCDSENHSKAPYFHLEH